MAENGEDIIVIKKDSTACVPCILCLTYDECIDLNKYYHDGLNGIDLFYNCTKVKLKDLACGEICSVCISNLLSCYQIKKKCEQLPCNYFEEGTAYTLVVFPQLVCSCLLCSSNEDCCNLIELEYEGKNGYDMFSYCTGKKLKNSYQLSVCGLCKNKLEKCYQFIERCESLTRQIEIYYDVPQSIECEEMLVVNDIFTEEAVDDVCNALEDAQEKLSVDIKVPPNELNVKPQFQIEQVFIKSEIPLDSLSDEKENKKQQKRVTCDICQKTYVNAHILNIHKWTHTNEKPFACEICKKLFTQKSSLREHKRTHSEARNYKCEICEKTFKTRKCLYVHAFCHASKTINCEMCDKAFKSKPELKTHMYVHNGRPKMEKRFTCATCGKSYKSRCILVDHFKLHTGEKPFKCEICSKAFKSRKDVKTHMKCHADVGLLCKFCDKKIRNKKNLRKHIVKYHESECGDEALIVDAISNAKVTNYVETRSKTHTGETFQCDICGRRVCSKKNLKRHITKCHKKCEHCDEAFIDEVNLNEHIINEHKSK